MKQICGVVVELQMVPLNREVLAVLPAGEHPPAFALDRLAHEYKLKDELDSAWAVRPLELVRKTVGPCWWDYATAPA